MKRNVQLIIFSLACWAATASTATEVAVVTPSSEVAHDLDLMAVSAVFKDTENLEAFERAINDPANGINNLDLDDNGYVDYIRVVSEVVGSTHVIILQAALGADEFQDVATIEVTQANDQYQMQIHGHEVVYGPDYYVVPAQVHVHTWPIIAWIYRPAYRPYRSVYYWGYHPKWWQPWRPVHFNVYRSKVLTYTGRSTFVVSKTHHFKPVQRVVYKPRTSSKVSRSFHVSKTNRANGSSTTRVGVKKTTTRADGTHVTKKKGVSKTNNRGKGTTTVKKGQVKTKTNNKGQQTKVKKTQKTTRKKY
ncbi:hypothetical protein [Marinicella meishanensis]|uniref:hypothetical protein n=1 Tax=Marinicella meishanensis TaxID=2873263 RepID=UPI001CC02712|nr:hypothetical protein [Marinicella sp. NBU2979]